MDNEELYIRAAFGQQIEEFSRSQIGNYLLIRAREVYTTNLELLKKCDPTDAKLVMRLQGEVWRAESFKHWLEEGVLDGLKALDLVEHPDGEE